MGEFKMTIYEFQEKFQIKNIKTIYNWIKSGYISGVTKNEKTGEYFIPELARPPYTNARAKKSDAIYRSIVKACVINKSVCAKLYKLDDFTFQIYINELSKAGYIRIEVQNGIEYYFPTIKSGEFLKNSNSQKFIKSFLANVAEPLIKGFAGALFEKTLA